MITPEDFFVLRRPTFSIQQITDFQNRLTTNSLAESLRKWYADPTAQEAIYLASPTLYRRFERWMAGENLPETEKLLQTLYKYAIRMSTRCTPYGVFAGYSVGSYSQQTCLRSGSPLTLHRFIRLDIEYLMALRDWLLSQPTVRQQVLFYPNNSLYAVSSGSYRYVEQQVTAGKRVYFISAVTMDQYLNAILTQAKRGATISQFTATVQQLGVPQEEATEFVEQLIAEQLLISSLEPTLIAGPSLSEYICKLEMMGGVEPLREALTELARNLTIGQPITDLDTQVRGWMRRNNVPMSGTDTLQVDAHFHQPTLSIGQSVVSHLRGQLRELLVLNWPYHCTALDEFTRRFYNRYEDEEIPLSLALDQEFGIGYGDQSMLGAGYAPMIDDLTLPTPNGILPPTDWAWWRTFVLTKYADSLNERRAEIELTSAELAEIKQQGQLAGTLPDSFYVFGSWQAASQEAVDRHDYLFSLQSCKGPSGVNLLTRFCEADPALAEKVTRSVRDTEAFNPDVVLAEVVHFTENRASNILSRPALYQYEIPYLGQPSVDEAHQIPLDDLLVSVRQGRVVLRSRRLNKRVIPRLTNAHNYHQGLPSYRFLCDLQQQDGHLDVRWNWSLLSEQAYLPRVRYKQIILSRATWRLRGRELATDNLYQLVIQLSEKRLPRQFVLAEHDHEMLIDLHIPQSLQLLAQELRKQETVRVYEFLGTSANCPVSFGGLPYIHEVVLPFRNPDAPKIPGLPLEPGELPQRRFTFGSEWLYVKVYTGEKSSDALLVGTIGPVIYQLLAKNIITQFFFVRYKDVDPHLRLRFSGNPHLAFHQVVMRELETALQSFVQEGLVHRVQVDTYVREIERYGYEHIVLCETLFHCDSLSTLAFLTDGPQGLDENSRFTFAIAKIDRLLSGVGLDYTDRGKLLTLLKDHYFEEFGGDAALRKQQGEKYRAYRPLLEQAVGTSFQAVLDRTDCASRDVLNRLRAAFPEDARLLPILQSMIHMLINRLFPAKQRAYELVIYHCLAKFYESYKAQQQVKSPL